MDCWPAAARCGGENKESASGGGNAKKRKWLEGERKGREGKKINLTCGLPRVIDVSETTDQNR